MIVNGNLPCMVVHAKNSIVLENGVVVTTVAFPRLVVNDSDFSANRMVQSQLGFTFEPLDQVLVDQQLPAIADLKGVVVGLKDCRE